MQEMEEAWVQSPDREDPLEESMASTPIFLPGESHGQRSLAGHSPGGGKESKAAWHTGTVLFQAKGNLTDTPFPNQFSA